MVVLTFHGNTCLNASILTCRFKLTLLLNLFSGRRRGEHFQANNIYIFLRTASQKVKVHIGAFQDTPHHPIQDNESI